MSGAGVPQITTIADGRGLNVTVVAGEWHEKVASGLLAGAVRYLEAAGASYTVVSVPGSFELPVASQRALQLGADAVVALGVIIRGGTPHFEYVARAATDGLSRVALDAGKPVGFGVLTVEDEEQALDRAGLPGSTEDKGAEAADAAVRLALTLKQMTPRLRVDDDGTITQESHRRSGEAIEESVRAAALVGHIQ